MLYLGLEGRYHVQLRDYERNLDEIEKLHVVPSNPSFYVQNASVTDPSLAPPGCSTLYCLAPVSHQHPNVDWQAERDRFRQTFLQQLAKVGLKDVEQRIRTERILTPADWQHGMQIYRGATFNLAHTLGQMLHRRPRNRFEDLEGVYLTGGGTHPGSGLPVIYESARITSRLVTQDLSSRPAGAVSDGPQTQMLPTPAVPSPAQQASVARPQPVTVNAN
jgi:phytoene desaturase